ncbi:MAG: sulfite exporter TauE/SafE family protein [Sarcina sp.]
MIYFLIALFACSIGSFVGLGGDLIIIPFLLSLGIPKALISVNTDLTMFFMSLLSTFIFFKRKQGDFKTAVLMAIGIIPGASLGVFINSKITIPMFKLIFILLLILLLLMVLLNNKVKDFKLPTITKPFIGLFIGTISGLFGIGGGIILIPVLLIFYNLNQKEASATTMYLVFISTIVTVTSYYLRGFSDFHYALFMIPGALIGSRIGTYFNKKASNKVISIVFNLILIFVLLKELIPFLLSLH